MRARGSAAAVRGGDAMNSALIFRGIVSALELAVALADGIGQVIVGQKVQEILDDAKFSTFRRRAEKAGDDARDALDGD